MATKTDILDAARSVLRRGESLTLDSVAREAGLTKPGLVYHFATKEVLSIAVMEYVLEAWEVDLTKRAGADPTPKRRLKTYVEHALATDFDASDLALLADVRVRETLTSKWTQRMDPWFGGELAAHPNACAARLIADGAWFNQSLSLMSLDSTDSAVVLELAMRLIDGIDE
ncbi:MAG: TetR family transcriptional regulator [Nocardioidaceae bacterium]